MSFFSSFGSSGSGNGIVRAGDTARRMRLLDDFEAAGLGWIWATDRDGQLIYLSENAGSGLENGLDALLARPMVELFEIDPDNPSARSDRPLKFIMAAHTRITDLIVRVRTAPGPMLSGPKTWWSISGIPKLADDGTFLGYRGSAKDVTVDYERSIVDSRMAEYDSLTGLANRHRMTKRLDGMLGAFKDAKRSLAVIMLDLDRFKAVNDSMGHPAGDALLKLVAKRLQSVVGTRGEVGRLGGDEFQIILPDVDDRGKLGELADKIVQIVSQPYPIDDKHAVIGTSIGIAIAPYDGVTREELARNADLALYAAKNGGRGQYRFYTDDLKDEAAERAALVEELRAAMASDGLTLHYQPVVQIADNHVVGCEALMRWENVERGPISPATFIPLAEEYGLVNELGAWALRRACADAVAWPAPLRVAVNVSAVQFDDSGFLDTLIGALEASGLEPERLELELTESVFLNDSESTELLFAEIKKLGVRLALDDFGTGFSSLSYLRSAPFDKLKVDKSFVSSCTREDKNSLKIIAAIIGLADALGMETTVEGVEAFDQLELISAKGARYVQGWLYSKALTNDDLVERLANGALSIEPKGPDKYRPERRSVYRRIGVVHEDHRYEAIVRDLSISGARIEGLVGVPVGEQMVLDLGKGQLALATVTRSGSDDFAVEFESPLIPDGAGGLCTRHRVSPYALAAAGMPLGALAGNGYAAITRVQNPVSKPKFMEVAVSARAA